MNWKPKQFILPLTMGFLVPSLLLLLFPRFKFYTLSIILGVILFIIGMMLIIKTVRLLMVKGKGTLAPWNPTKKLVIHGPYQYVRNPMITGVLFIILSETSFFFSIPVLIWGVLFFVVNHLYFIISEEPGLKKRFGEEYTIYQKHVPRWIPRLTPWKLDP